MDLVRNLCRELVKRQRRDQADHSVGRSFSDRSQVRVAKRGKAREPKDAAGQFSQFPGIPQGVERPGVDACGEGFSRSQRAAKFAERFAGAFVGSGHR
jgi:hypothetical protein